jgi:hypothetical protein
METDARADLVARGLFGDRDLYTDTAVLDTGADSYRRRTATAILVNHEKEKIRAYGDRVAPHGSFVPLVCSCFGTLGPAAQTLAFRVARRVDPDRDARDAVMDLHHAVMQVAILKAVSLCLRARSWALVPAVREMEVVEDPVRAVDDAGIRDGL